MAPKTRKSAAAPARRGGQPKRETPAVPEPAPRYVNGLRVVNAEPLRSAGLVAIHGESVAPSPGREVLTLEDGSKVTACTECDEVGKQREMARHYKNFHSPLSQSTETVSEPNVLQMTIGEVLHLARQLGNQELFLEKTQQDFAARLERIRADHERQLERAHTDHERQLELMRTQRDAALGRAKAAEAVVAQYQRALSKIPAVADRS